MNAALRLAPDQSQRLNNKFPQCVERLDKSQVRPWLLIDHDDLLPPAAVTWSGAGCCQSDGERGWQENIIGGEQSRISVSNKKHHLYLLCFFPFFLNANTAPPLKIVQRGTWHNSSSAKLCQCRCLPCGFESRLVQDFQRNIMSPLSILGHCFDVVSLGKALNHQMLNLIEVKMSTW